MKLSLGLPVHRVDRLDELAGAGAIAELSAAAEEAGFDAVFVTDHPFPDDRWLTSGGHHTLDPMVALSFAAAATTRVRLLTNLYVAAYRNPFITAKAVATLDALSGGRVILGLGAGYMEGELRALGVGLDERNDLTDEAITAMRRAWSGESVVMTGRHFTVAGNTMLPTPARPGGPPIWIGGNSRRAIHRAVELGDGWVPMPSPARAAKRLRTPPVETLDELRARLDYAREHARVVGRRARLEVVFMPLGLDMFTNADVDAEAVVASIGELAEVGVTYVTTTVPGETRDEVLGAIARFRNEILPEVATL